ncbi:MAG: SDR family NAD(P)-dependent oxidoreductase [Actinomycetota bacterium]
MELRGAVGILTGASRGIGVYLAQRLAGEGVSLALAARSEDALAGTAELLREQGVRALTVATDVTKRSELQRLVKRTTDELGPIDLVVNNAGIETYCLYQEAEPNDLEAILHTNVLGPMLLTRYALPGMVERGRGHVVNVASAAGKTALPYNTAYSSSKHALVGFSWSLREELRPYGIGVSVVCPGFVSDAGLFASWAGGRRPPGVAGSVAPEKVAEATVRAIRRNRAEVIVSGGLGKLVDVFHALSPELTTGIARRGGLYSFLEQEARR